MISQKEKDEIARKIKEDPYFIYSKKYDFNILNLINREDFNPKRIRIDQLLQMTVEEVDKIYNSALSKYRHFFGIDVDLNDDEI
jgi:hypothetical protein